MAATDQTYRSQRTLDIAFGATCVLMLVSIVWMFADDYLRPFKVEQRNFRDVETAVAERAMLNLLPDSEKMKQIDEAQNELAKALTARNAKEKELHGRISKLLPEKVDSEARAQALKADFDSEVSLYNIVVEQRNMAEPGSALHKALSTRVEEKLKKVERLRQDLEKAQLKVEDLDRQLDAVRKEGKTFVDAAVKAEEEVKRLTADFDRFAKLTVQKRWKMGDWFRALPVIDAFKSPTRIEQYTLEALPIDYNFKYVTRFDRCTTCHLGIDRPSYSREALRDLTREPTADMQTRLANARKMLETRRKTLPMLEASFDESDLPSTVKKLPLNNARITEYSAHPRLDLFVEGNSRHPAEKFGCTVCHSGQGSATDFYNASHSPDNFVQKEAWRTEKSWHSNHYWDYPMLPSRFLESSCLKCHHQVTDLLPEGNKIDLTRKDTAGKQLRVDTPGAKVTQGYNLVRENGCFGCHEIPGVKGGRWVGPDLRLEPVPPLEDLSPAAREKALSDPANPPGSMRKVGPSLRRLSEKTNEEWVRKWLFNPRGFRPDTKMPHFYNLSNNDAEALKGTGQEQFPQAEIHAIAFYLFRKSEAALPPDKRLPEIALPADYKEDKARGRQLFSERGCLACHKHAGTETANQGFPALVSEAHFGPNLSRLAAKLGTKAGDRASARRWLVQWIKEPTVHHPRTFMPVTHLDDSQASDLTAWLLDQSVQDWNVADVPAPSEEKAFENLARVYLNKAMTRFEVDEIFKSDTAAQLQKTLDADDRSLAEKLDVPDKLKVYIGKKAINQLGCFGCHDVPGFEQTKPIGTPLNDWGKKDPERLAFEDISAFVRKNYHFVDKPVDEKGLGYPRKDNKDPYEKFYLEALEHHQREGFLHQKLREPRSYDYDRLRSWDERLRMPQFKFARGEAKPRDGETEEQAELRAEAEAREAVMTFILGLVAEPVPLAYVYRPTGDRLAEVRGKQVLDKFNCAGCHQLRSGTYEFSTLPRVVEGERQRVVLDELDIAYKRMINPANTTYTGDIPFPGHNAWTGRLPAQSDRLKVHAIPTSRDEEESLRLRLTQALRFNRADDLELPLAEREKKALDLPAGENLGLPVGELLFRASPHGGTFTDLLVPYLIQRKNPNYDDDPKARSGLPPPLLREGEKVQPSWLFQFLRNPQPLRPLTILRMPRFNMSDEEAMALANYFAAVDRHENVGVTLNYPYLAIPQRDEGFWSGKAREYTTRLSSQKKLDERLKELRPLFEKLQRERLEELSEEVKAAEKAAQDAKPDARKAAEERRDALRAQLKKLNEEGGRKEFVEAADSQWEKEEAYASDGYRLLANYNLCLKCHQVGNLPPSQAIGPRLDLSYERLRPDWTERWIGSPQRLLIYPIGFHPMPQPFPKDKQEYQDLFAGSAREQASAVRDVLMFYPKVAHMPANRYYRPAQGAGQ